MSRYSNEPFDFDDHSRIQEFLTENFISTTAKWKLQEFCGINCPGSLRSPIVFLSHFLLIPVIIFLKSVHHPHYHLHRCTLTDSHCHYTSLF